MKTQIDSKSLYFENIGDKTIYYSYNTTVAIATIDLIEYKNKK